MPRAVKEWIGRTDDSRVPPRVRLRIFDLHEGRCHISGRKIRQGEAWELEHIVALCNGGEHRESNMAPALAKPHKAKTASDIAEKAVTARKRKHLLGVKRPKRIMPGSRAHPWKHKLNGDWVRR